MMYSKKVFQHFRNPKNLGEIKKPDGYAKVGNPVCLPSEELININSNVQKIEEIKPREKVLGSDGRYHQVTKVLKRRYSGLMLNIRIHNLGKTTLTPEHHVLAIKLAEFSHKYVAFRRLFPKRILPDWYRADELEKGDFILYPVLKKIRDRKFKEFDIGIPKWDFKSKVLPEKITINQDFLRLVGYYLSEGSSRTTRCKGTLIFTFGSHEERFIKDTIFLMDEIFKLSPSHIYQHHNSTNIVFYSARLARFFAKHFGKGAINKQISSWIMTLPEEKQQALICGLWRGDGYISKRQKAAKFVTISKVLANQLKQLLLRQKIIFSFLETASKGIHKRHYSFYVKEDKSLKKLASIVGERVHFFKNQKNPGKTWFHQDYYYAPIWKIEKFKFNGEVFNLEVDKAHSFVSNSLILHNCGDIMQLYLRVGQKNGQAYIKNIKFQTLGCAAAIATSSVLTEMVKGKTLEEAEQVKSQDVVKALGGLPNFKLHCSLLIVKALKKAIGDYKRKTLLRS